MYWKPHVHNYPVWNNNSLLWAVKYRLEGEHVHLGAWRLGLRYKPGTLWRIVYVYVCECVFALGSVSFNMQRRALTYQTVAIRQTRTQGLSRSSLKTLEVKNMYIRNAYW